MNNINNKRREAAFYPCGLEIPKDKIFDSPRNLGLSLMAALTGIPTEDLEINRGYVAIGLGCIGLIGINHGWYERGDDVAELDENDDWGLLGAINFELDDEVAWFTSIKHKKFPTMFFNINPSGLLESKGAETGSVQLFGSARLLKRLKTPENRFEDYSGSHSVERFLDDDESIEENDSILTPSEFEFDLYREEQDPEKKFRILLNMITSFASTVSMRLLYWGRIRLTCIYSTSGAVNEDLMWGKNGVDDVWIPTQEEVLRYLEQKGKTIDDIPAERRNLIWPKQ